MTLEYLELMEDVKRSEKTARRKLAKSFKSNTRIYDDGSIEVELKCPEEVPDKAAYFQKELAKLMKDIAIGEPQLPEGEFLLDKEQVKVKVSPKERRVAVWLTF